MDAMALAIHPMMAIDATRIPRGGDTRVRPGRTILTNGDPRTVMMPFNFGQVGTNTFAQSGELERMIQMATGAMDSAAPVGVSPRNATASGMSMIASGAIKRSKRTLANIENNFTKPLVQKVAWRYMQFAPYRYPLTDVKFNVHSTLGIMAREFEQQQLVNLLQTVPAESPAFWLLIRNIYENSSISNKDEMIQYVDMFLQQASQPKQDPMAALRQQEIELKKQTEQLKLQIENSRAQTEAKRVEIEAAKAQSQIEKTKNDAVLSFEKAKSEQVDSNIAMREQALKERELELKQQDMLIKKELEEVKLLQSAQQKAPEEKQQPPVVNIHGSAKKRIVVNRTANGLEGYSEEVE